MYPKEYKSYLYVHEFCYALDTMLERLYFLLLKFKLFWLK